MNESPLYFNGIRAAHERGEIVIHGGHPLTGPSDDFNFLDPGKKGLTEHNTRFLSPTNERLLQWLSTKVTEKLRVCFVGAGAGVEVENALQCVNCIPSTISRTPFNPDMLLRVFEPTLRQLLRWIGSPLKDKKPLMLDELWNCHRDDRRIFTPREGWGRPLPPIRQRIGNFPMDFQTGSHELREENLLVESRGPLYHSLGSDVAHAMYALLSPRGCVSAIIYHHGKGTPFADVMEKGDILARDVPGSQKYDLFLAREESPLAEHLHKNMCLKRGQVNVLPMVSNALYESMGKVPRLWGRTTS